MQMHNITSSIFAGLTADDLPGTDDAGTATTETNGVFAKAKAGKAKRNAKALKGVTAPDGLGTSRATKAETAAPGKKALFAAKPGAKGDAPAKAIGPRGKAKLATKALPKADKPAKAAAAPKPATTKTTPAAVDNPLDALGAQWNKASGDEAVFRDLLQQAYDAGKASPRTRAPRAGGPSKRDLAVDLLLRKGGCTAKDILTATGWPTVSVPAIARSANLTLNQTKEGRVTTYSATRA